MIRVLLVEDQAMPKKLFEIMLEQSDRYELCYAIENAAMAEIYCLRNRVDLILMDVCTSDGESGLDAARVIKEKYPSVKIIIVTSMLEHSFLQQAKDAGCESFWYKSADEHELLSVMDRTMAGESIYPDATPALTIGNASSTEFTKSELEILRALVNGKTYAEIAKERGTSASGVKYHVTNMLQKTGYTSSTRLAVDVVEKHLILPD